MSHDIHEIFNQAIIISKNKKLTNFGAQQFLPAFDPYRTREILEYLKGLGRLTRSERYGVHRHFRSTQTSAVQTKRDREE